MEIPLELAEIVRRWQETYDYPLLSSETFKADGREGLDTRLRSVYWRAYLGVLPLPTSQKDAFSASYTFALQRSRREWEELQERYLTAPDGRSISSSVPPSSSHKMPVSIDPLSLESSNPWGDWFKDLELREELRKDVLRTFPDTEYFRNARVQEISLNILQVWTKLNGDIGYRQGMHELLAPLLLVLDRESIPASAAHQNNASGIMYETLSRDYLEHDTWALFSAFMSQAKSWYDQTPSIDVSGQPKNKVQPVIAQINRLQNGLLPSADPQLHQHLSSLGIEPQLWALRWIRCLFGREFELADTLRLWDGIFSVFAQDHSLKIVDYVCLALLERMRETLLEGDFSTTLQALLHLPEHVTGNPRIRLLLQQALLFRDGTTLETSTQIYQQNIEHGFCTGCHPINTSTSYGSPQPQARNTHRRAESALPQWSPSLPNSLNEGRDMVGNFATNIYGRSEALGINRAVLGTLGELKRSVGAYHHIMSPPADNSGFPKDLSSVQTSRSTAHIHDLTSELSNVKASNANLSDLIALCIDKLQHQPESLPQILPVLNHAKEVLAGKTTYDPSMLSSLTSTTPQAVPLARSTSHEAPPKSRPGHPTLHLSSRDTQVSSALPRVGFGRGIADTVSSNQGRRGKIEDPLGA